ncbi:hypothetical protein BKA56DRAFT_678523 [Ilyonectria sp. MPI-CAGE-AT-0026]|nr:hypothetical protein BKA56DRAFT_678523 [Ilyonectria sp. MPI-CAGE-AT-0026]
MSISFIKTLEKAYAAKDIIGIDVQVLNGTYEAGFTKTSEKRTVLKLLNPVPNAPSVMCAGINYKLHSKEISFIVPTSPVIFITPAERLAGALDPVIAHDDAQPMLDYEGELTFILSKDTKDIKEEDGLNYILGYTVGNDFPARSLIPVETSGNQMGYSKSFDTFGPIGPCIITARLIPDPQTLHLVTRVNGQVRQDANTAEMTFSVKQLISYASRNRILKKGTVFMTGIPNGVGWFSNGLLNDGDEVDVEISEIGSISNKVVFK